MSYKIMNKYDTVLCRDSYKKNGYSEKEIDIIGELDFFDNSYREKLESSFNGKIDIDFEKLFEIIKKIEDDSEINEKIKRYAEYLYGVALPFYDENIKQEDIDELKNIDGDLDNIFTDLKNVKAWTTIEKRNIKDDSYHNKLDDIILSHINEKIKKHIINSRYKWSVIVGIYHHFLIKNYKTNKLLKN